MASPQTEDGYTRIANELLEAIYKIRLSGGALRVVLWILRKSYGWGRKWTVKTAGGDVPKVMDIARELNMPHATLVLALRVLLDANVIEKSPEGRYRINKDYDSWCQTLETRQKTDTSENGRKVVRKLTGSRQKTDGSSSKNAVKRYASKGPKETRKKQKETHTIRHRVSGDYFITKTEGFIICAYKQIRGLNPADREWDRHNYSRNVKPAAGIVSAFRGDTDKAIDWLAEFGRHMDGRKLSWTLETAQRHAWDRGGK